LLGEYDANGAIRFETIYLGDVPVGVVKPGATSGATANAASTPNLYQVYADHLGAPRLITDTRDNIVWRWDSAEPFGASAPDQNPHGAGVFVYDQRLPGQVFDAETGLFDNWHRTYDARQGRYRQSDPIGLGGGINTYGYVGGNPISRIDPSGKNALLGAELGGEIGTLIFPGPGTLVGAILGGIGGYWIIDQLGNLIFNEPPANAYDPIGPKAPGRPGSTEGFCEPKGGEDWVRNPNGRGNGWRARDGGVWVPTGPDSGSSGDAHGGAHWDVQYPDGGYENVYPGGLRR